MIYESLKSIRQLQHAQFNNRAINYRRAKGLTDPNNRKALTLKGLLKDIIIEYQSV